MREEVSSSRRLHLWLLAMLLLLTLFYVATVLLDEATEPSQGKDFLVRLFDLNAEASVGTWFNTTLWLLCAAQASKLARRDLMRRRYWLGLVFLSAYFSLDEAAQVHEGIGFLLDDRVTGLPFYSWLLVGVPLALLVALLYLKFLFSLERRTALMMVASGGLFLFGAVGMEAVGGFQDLGVVSRLPFGLGMRPAILVEEFCEMLGVLGFSWSLSRHAMVVSSDVPARPLRDR